MTYIIYNSVGEILRAVTCPVNMIDIQLSTDESYIEGTCNDVTQYVLNNVLTDKPSMDTILTDNIITGLPVPSTVSVDGQVFSVSDGVLEFTIDQVGTYEIICEAVNYLPMTYQATV